MRVLITGAGGQVGAELVAAFSGHEVTALTHADLDVTDPEAAAEAIGAASPDAVVHAAAWTAVDDCEADPERALLVNGVATRFVARAARTAGARLCYLSTDYVFAGEKAAPYVESDPTGPASAYGRSKLAGEREAGPSALIVRTSWVCGEHGANMVKTILRLARGDGRLRFVNDQRGHPTFAADLAPKIRDLVVDDHTGIVHVTNQGAVSWYEFARAVLDASGDDASRVEPVTTAELQPPRPAPRPANSILENAALVTRGVPLLGDFREPLSRLVSTLSP